MNPRLIPVLTAWLMLAVFARAAEPAVAPGPALTTHPLEAYSGIGSSFAQTRRLGELGWNEAQIDAFLEGVRASFQGKPRPIDDRVRALFEDVGRRLQQIDVEGTRARQAYFAEPGRVESFMKEMTKNFQLRRSDSGLAFGLLGPAGGSASRPGPDDTVVITCNAVAADGKTELPQASLMERRIKVADLMPGLAEGVQMMAPGGSAMLIVPPDLSYDQGEWPQGVGRGVPLLYTVNLHEIVVAP